MWQRSLVCLSSSLMTRRQTWMMYSRSESPGVKEFSSAEGTRLEERCGDIGAVISLMIRKIGSTEDGDLFNSSPFKCAFRFLKLKLRTWLASLLSAWRNWCDSWQPAVMLFQKHFKCRALKHALPCDLLYARNIKQWRSEQLLHIRRLESPCECCNEHLGS